MTKWYRLCCFPPLLNGAPFPEPQGRASNGPGPTSAAGWSGPYERRAVSTRINSVENADPDILVAMSRQALF